MKTIFQGPSEAVELITGRCHFQAVQLETGDWLCVAEIADVDLRQAILATPGVVELPHPNSGAPPPPAVLTAIASAAAGGADLDQPAPAPAPPANTRDVVQATVDRLGMPAMLHLLDR